MKLYVVDPVTLSAVVLLISFLLPRFINDEKCSVTFVNDNGVKYQRDIACKDVDKLTVYAAEQEGSQEVMHHVTI
ncbi:hypothetical protein C9J12_21185 [Photobacterium frigidiphilum]|uniref:Uncharacterized protein n=1 Tax=Photobacterium frigidiphilum TaxID=264736 RepID=A0A2T3JA93_9GAMM|nr:hypothetical protein [Photobacterium frigidiphilum]PSU45758.1 hypothetical protein C9J12_21185 [Photobacterium frigidiphilum]